MIWNLALLFLLFGATTKKVTPYAAAAALGAVKGVFYFLASQNIVVAALAFLIFGSLAAAMVFLLSRITSKEATEEPSPLYATKSKSSFKWEYLPLFVIVVLLIFGELALAMMRA